MHLESASWVATIAGFVLAVAVAFHQFGREKMLKSIALVCVILLCLVFIGQSGILTSRPALPVASAPPPQSSAPPASSFAGR